ncbi:hypothetical protein H8959_012050 [Pygathrix nigripes]
MHCHRATCPSHLGLSVLHFQEAYCSLGQAPQPLPKPVFSRMGRPGLAHSPPHLSGNHLINLRAASPSFGVLRLEGPRGHPGLELVSTCLHEPGAPVSLCAREARPIQVLCPIAGAGEGLGVLPGRGQKGAHPGDTHPRPKSSRTSGNCTGPGGRRCRDTLRPREVQRGPERGPELEQGEGAQPGAALPPPKVERAGAVSVRAPRRRLHPGSLLQRQRRRPCLSSSSSFSLASASSFPSVLPGCLRCSRRGARSPRRAPGLAVPCCPGGGVEGWRRRCLRPPRGTCGCCGCCSLASSSARPCVEPPPATRVSERAGRRPRGSPGPGSPGGSRVAGRSHPRPSQARRPCRPSPLAAAAPPRLGWNKQARLEGAARSLRKAAPDGASVCSRRRT